MQDKALERWRGTWGMILCMGLMALAAGSFAYRQTLWLDETTQLSGLSLGPVGVTRWLAGTWHDFGCPTAPDRMPPVSYWVGQMWGAVFGFSELSLRWMGVACATGAVGLIYATGRRAFGRRAGLAAGLMVALAPSVVEKAVEIRAYPLYLLTSAAAFYAAVRWMGSNQERGERGGGRGWLAMVIVCLLLTMFTHFIGVVCAGAVLGGMGLAVGLRRKWETRNADHGMRKEGRGWAELIGAMVVVAAGAALLTPFVSASAGVSEHGAHFDIAARLVALGETVWNLFSHRVMATNYALPLLVLATIVMVAALVWVRRPKRRDAAAGVWWMIFGALALGGAAIGAATFVFSAFKPAQYQYNLWMVPAVALLVGSAVREGEMRNGENEKQNGDEGISRFSTSAFRIFSGVAILMLLALGAVGVARVAWLGPNIAHGPDPLVVATIRAAGPEKVVVIYDAGSEYSAVQTYYPLSYLFHGAVRQYKFDPERHGWTRFDHPEEPLAPAEAAADVLVIVRSGDLKLADLLGTTPRDFGAGPAVRAVEASGLWRREAYHTYIGMMKVNTYVYRRAAVGMAGAGAIW